MLSSKALIDPTALIERLQTWMRGLDVTVLGSGASADYGYPLMTPLADHLKSSVSAPAADAILWADIRSKLDQGVDLETALNDIRSDHGLIDDIIAKTWALVSARDLDFYHDLTQGRTDFALADLIKWLETARRRIDVVTTNYDRVIEYACDVAGTIWIDGTGFGYFKRGMRGFETVVREHPKSPPSTIARIWKVHGSLDWFSVSGNGIFTARSLRTAIPEGTKPLIVTPGQGKYERALDDPFRTILTGADEVMNNASAFLCVGYGFNDKHVHTKLIRKAQDPHSRFIILARTLTDNTKKFLFNGGCKNFIAIERLEENGRSQVYLPEYTEPISMEMDVWSMRGLCKAII